MGPYKPGLGTSDAGRTQQESQVGGESKLPRMGNPVAVEEPEVRLYPEPADCLQDERPFSK